MTVAAAIALTCLAGCGGDKPDISADAAERLDAKVAEIRAHAEARDAGGVTATLAELRSLVDQLQVDGELTDTAADRITAAATNIGANLASITTTTTAPDKEDDEDEHGKGRKGGDGRD